MSITLLPLPPTVEGAELVAYLNDHMDAIRPALDLDVSWAYIRAVVDDVRVIAAERGGRTLRITYEYDYSAHCACKNLDATDTQTDHLTCDLCEGSLVLREFVPAERSTADEF
ncbi:MAG: hypothetical protein JNM82_08055 [Rhodocyclaceae bacterium]|nr:hypothetical protein [Rhodocyclaceae bacterium]